MDTGYDKVMNLMIEWGNAINNGEYRIANRKYKTILALIKEFNEDESFETIIENLLSCSAVPVKYWAFVIALKNNVFENIAVKGLTDLATKTSSGPIGALARIGVIEWEKRNKTQINN